MKASTPAIGLVPLWGMLAWIPNSCIVSGLSLSMNVVDSTEAARLSRGRLHEALCSPSGKLTLSPEIVIPEPTDPTAILLQSSQITKLSERIRTEAKANTAWICGSIDALRQIVQEQEEARGFFPGPVPLIYCPNTAPRQKTDFEQIARAGASGVLLRILEGNPISDPDDIQNDDAFGESFRTGIDCGVQCIPEVVLNRDCTWDESRIQALCDAISHHIDGTQPASIVLTLNTDEDSESSGNQQSSDEDISLPSIPKQLSKTIPILGSVRVLAGQNRMARYTSKLKEHNFTGAFLRSDCVPGFRMNPDLDIVAGFWTAAIKDLKSTKSKTFSFRSKNKMGTDAPTEWLKYQKSVVESGALGWSSSAEPGEDDLNADAGDFKGF